MSATGAPRVCAELAAVLHESGAQVTLSVPGSSVEDSTIELFSQRVDALVPFLSSRVTLDIGARLEFAASFDLVVVSTADPRQAQWIMRFRKDFPRHSALIWWVHEGESVMGVFAPSATENALHIMLDSSLNCLVFPSKSARDWWILSAKRLGLSDVDRLLSSYVFYWGIPHWREKIFHDAVVDLETRLSTRAFLGFDEQDFVYIVLASFHAIKGHDGIVQAFRSLRETCPGPSLRLLMIGGGFGFEGHFPSPASQWAINDPQIRIVGPTREVAKYLAAADAYVSNTMHGGETWGLGTLEALASERVVLSSGVGGALEQLQHNNTALIHSNDDSAQLAVHMCAVASNSLLRKRLTSNGVERAFIQLGQLHIETSLSQLISPLLLKN